MSMEYEMLAFMSGIPLGFQEANGVGIPVIWARTWSECTTTMRTDIGDVKKELSSSLKVAGEVRSARIFLFC